MNYFVFICLLIWPLVILCQDLQFECITCADKFDRCELDCAWSNIGAEDSYNVIVACQDACKTTLDSCKDTAEATACLACTVACSATYDTTMRGCLSTTSRTMKNTKSLSDCEYNANKVMDTCMSACSPHPY